MSFTSVYAENTWQKTN